MVTNVFYKDHIVQWKSTNSLLLKIFAAFWLLIALLISALILLPQLDSRQLQPINQADTELISQHSSNLKTLIENNPLLSEHSILCRTMDYFLL